jgi:hypothetical protein
MLETLYEWFQSPMELDLLTNQWSEIDTRLLYDPKDILDPKSKIKHWRFSSGDIISLFKKRGITPPGDKWIKDIMEVNLGLKSDVKYFKPVGKTKRGWLIYEDFLMKKLNIISE